MTKTTNYMNETMQKEIRDKLIKIGYTGKTDLETLLDALPSSIPYKNEYYYFFLWGNTLGYYYENSEYRDNYNMGDGLYEFSKLSLDESLADTAGRLIIELHEKNLIKF